MIGNATTRSIRFDKQPKHANRLSIKNKVLLIY